MTATYVYRIVAWFDDRVPDQAEYRFQLGRVSAGVIDFAMMSTRDGQTFGHMTANRVLSR